MEIVYQYQRVHLNLQLSVQQQRTNDQCTRLMIRSLSQGLVLLYHVNAMVT
jgi:hypothetical protein